mmetsp:Transcript_22875/g.39533  ORF Transcript_22875/g.39533 Transcript_22875/m.39533 type:complete len:200 (+) Transcript_22875:321-920(+)
MLGSAALGVPMVSFNHTSKGPLNFTPSSSGSFWSLSLLTTEPPFGNDSRLSNNPEASSPLANAYHIPQRWVLFGQFGDVAILLLFLVDFVVLHLEAFGRILHVVEKLRLVDFLDCSVSHGHVHILFIPEGVLYLFRFFAEFSHRDAPVLVAVKHFHQLRSLIVETFILVFVRVGDDIHTYTELSHIYILVLVLVADVKH